MTKNLTLHRQSILSMTMEPPSTALIYWYIDSIEKRPVIPSTIEDRLEMCNRGLTCKSNLGLRTDLWLTLHLITCYSIYNWGLTCNSMFNRGLTCNLIFLPSLCTVLILKSIPIVEQNPELKISSVKRVKNAVFPTAELPMIKILNRLS